MKKAEINRWIRYFFPIVLSLVLGMLVFMLAQFREPPSFEGYSLIWFTVSTFLIWEAGWRISRSLDQKYPWKEGVFKRLSLQVISLGLVGIVFFISLYIILNLYENIILGQLNPLGYLHLLVSAVLGLILVLIISSVQVSYLLLQSWQQIELEAVAFQKAQVMTKLETVSQMIETPLVKQELASLPAAFLDHPEEAHQFLTELSTAYLERKQHLESQLSAIRDSLAVPPSKEHSITSANKKGNKASYKNRFLLKQGAKYVLVPTKDIVACYKDDLVLICTKAGKKYASDYSLDELMHQLPPNQFFRINRQCIIHSSYLEELKMEGAQMRLTLSASFPYPLIVSQRNIPIFKKWLENH